MKIVAAALALALTAALGTGPAQAERPSTVVLPTRAAVLDDGSVRITFRVRCQDDQQAFEWSVAVGQGTTVGSDGAGPAADLLTCDGRLRRVRALVVADEPFAVGAADVEARVQLYDEELGSDLELVAERVVRLRAPRCASC